MTFSIRLREKPEIIFLSLFLFLGSCSSYRYPSNQIQGISTPYASYIEGVPFFPGKDFQCGPSSLASVLTFSGIEIKPEDIRDDIFLEKLHGTLKMDMIIYAQRFVNKGIMVREISGDIEMLKKEIVAGYPVVVFTDLGFWNVRKGHYMVVVGYDDKREGVIVYSGTEKDKFISYNRFMRIWERGGYWGLLVSKKE